MTTNVPLIRLVDDDELFRVSQMMLLKTRGWEVECYESGEAFLEKADLKRPGCIILDVRMEGLTGMQVHRELVERGCKLAVIFLTGHGDIPMAVRAMQRGAVSFLESPSNLSICLKLCKKRWTLLWLMPSAKKRLRKTERFLTSSQPAKRKS